MRAHPWPTQQRRFCCRKILNMAYAAHAAHACLATSPPTAESSAFFRLPHSLRLANGPVPPPGISSVIAILPISSSSFSSSNLPLPRRPPNYPVCFLLARTAQESSQDHPSPAFQRGQEPNQPCKATAFPAPCESASLLRLSRFLRVIASWPCHAPTSDTSCHVSVTTTKAARSDILVPCSSSIR